MRLPLIRLLAAIIVAALLSPAAALDYLPSGPAASPPSDGRARGLATVYQPAPYALLQTFWIGANGAVRAVRKERNGRWRQAYDLTPPRWGIPDSPVAAAWQDAGELLRVFWVDSAGTANLLESEHDQWAAPVKIGPVGYFAPGAQLSAVWQPGDGQMMVFGLDRNGELKMLHKSRVSAVFTNSWMPSARLSGYNFGAPGGAVAAVYQPYGSRVLAFAVGKDGRVNYVTQSSPTTFIAPKSLLSPAAVPAGGNLTAAWYPLQDQIEVFWVDKNGAAHVLYSVRNGNWSTQTLTGGGFGTPGSALSVVYQPLHEHLEVAAITPGGGINLLWKENNGAWKTPQQIVGNGTVPTPTVPRGAFQREGNQLEIFYFDAVGQLWDIWKSNDGAWNTPFRLTDIGGDTLLKAGECSVFFNRWSNHRTIADTYLMNECTRLMGIEAYCAARDSFIAFDLYDNDTRSRLICAPRSHPDSLGEQAEHLVRGVEQGLRDALIAAAPYLGPVTEGISCASGVVFACAALALDVAGRLNNAAGNPLPDAVADMLPVANRALSCAEGDYVACVSLGHDGVEKLTGVDIPTVDVTELVMAANDCRNGIIGACMQIGQKAVEAAGVPLVAVQDATSLLASAQKCLIAVDADRAESSADCRSLGTALAKATGIDSAIVDTAGKGAACARGDSAACTDLGLAAARGLVPAKLTDAVVQNGRQCLADSIGACLDIALAAANAAGLPTADAASLHACAEGNVSACTDLAGKMTGVPFGTAIETATKVSRCAAGDVMACVELGRDAVKIYDPYDGTMAERVSGVVTGRGLGNPLGTARISPDTDWANGHNRATPAAPSAAVPPPSLPVQATPVPPPVAPEPVQPAVPAVPAAGPVPQGQCPAATAIVRQGLNIRNGAGGAVIGNVAGGTRVQCLACTDSWCLIAASDPRASVSRRYLDFEMPQPARPAPVPPPPVEAEQPPPPVQQQTPPPPPAEEAKPQPANFAGDWWVRTSTGLVFQFHIAQQERTAGGNFSDNLAGGGQFSATVVDRTMTLQWFSSQGYSGIGTFTMHADGASFDGSYRPTQIPPFDMGNGALYRVPGTWESFVPPPPRDDLPLDYGGCAACGDDVFVGPK
jgi:hypothetical protein